MINDIQTISRKIGIIGTARSGKTVLLTSLINHLIEHNRTDFVIGSGKPTQISSFKLRTASQARKNNFNYAAYRDALAYKGEWPEKTTDISHFVCDFKRSDWSFFRNKLQFFDVPGERIADFGIGQHCSFGQWSDYMLKYIQSDTAYRNKAEDFLELQSRDSLQENEVLNSYRDTLARYTINFKPMISPSTFILDREGKMPESQSIDDFLAEARTRYLGLPPKNEKSLEFAPLSAQARENNPTLTKAFAHAYRIYRESIVLPLLRDLKSSNRLIVLIDIPSLCNGGVAMYNDNRELLEQLVDILLPDSWMDRIVSILKFARFDRVAFVATKADAVHPCDVEEGRLLSLLRQMTDRFTYELPDIEIERFICSAVVSAKPTEDAYSMRGVLANNPGAGEVVYNVPKLPESWPTSWEAGDFKFPSVLPRIPANKGIPPEQFGLDKVFSFITKD